MSELYKVRFAVVPVTAWSVINVIKTIWISILFLLTVLIVFYLIQLLQKRALYWWDNLNYHLCYIHSHLDVVLNIVYWGQI